jgi:predicted RNA-binding protein with PIN domain
MRYLIDGYNLMYALGLVRRDGGRAGWDRARRQMLDWLAERLGSAAADATVALDAQNARPTPIVVESYRGLFVVRMPSRAADDLIEDLLRSETSRESLTVVSNDARVRDTAKRRGCRVLRCAEFVDALMKPPSVNTIEPRPDDEKAVQPTAQEQADWLRAFGG